MRILRHFSARDVGCTLRYCFKFQASGWRRLFSRALRWKSLLSGGPLASGHTEASRPISRRFWFFRHTHALSLSLAARVRGVGSFVMTNDGRRFCLPARALSKCHPRPKGAGSQSLARILCAFATHQKLKTKPVSVQPNSPFAFSRLTRNRKFRQAILNAVYCSPSDRWATRTNPHHNQPTPLRQRNNRNPDTRTRHSARPCSKNLPLCYCTSSFITQHWLA